ncbi:hypothetical protein M378DRAFT_168930 [Amanita muscaria Koide BX008]|uniref:Uncharacterized protein n=1 Tax=Amanita muscaria (strain Koide BX008) TaxID=946122 RepID=A0A0C2WTL8_AMAMK|nr:hypothetical protein M378DRAFT_168930 [Amanita muscaria Koide BX008]
MDLERMHDELYRGRYLTPCETQRHWLTKTLTGCMRPKLCIPSRRLASSSLTRPSRWSVNVWLCGSASAEESAGRAAKREVRRGATAAGMVR